MNWDLLKSDLTLLTFRSNSWKMWAPREITEDKSYSTRHYSPNRSFLFKKILRLKKDLFPLTRLTSECVLFAICVCVCVCVWVRVSLCFVRSHVELLYLVMDVALWKVLDVGELQVQLRQPHQHALSGAFKVLPLAGEILREKMKWREGEEGQKAANTGGF